MTRDLARFAILTAILLLASYQYYSLSRELYLAEIERKGKGYVSDEVWYVSSSRNILNKIFEYKPKLAEDRYGVSVVYNDAVLNRSFIQGLIKERNLSVNLTDTRYSKIRAFYFESSDFEELLVLIEELNETGGVIDVVWGWRLADHENINNYFNLEHPPLYKYLICLSIAFFGDSPISWRIPSIVAGALTILFTYLAGSKLLGNKWLSLVVALLTGVDPITRTLSSVALIDIYVALFTSIALYFALSKKLRAALAAAVVGSLFKFSSLFLLIPILALLVRERLRGDPSAANLVKSLLLYSALALTLFVSAQVLASVPLILHFDFSHWFQNSIVEAFKWHASVKCAGPACPVSSAPWDWFIGNNAFLLYYFDAGSSLAAVGFWPLWIVSVAYLILFLPTYKLDRRAGYIQLFLVGLALGYIALYALGGRTQYSFYAVQFAPLIYLNLIYSFTCIVLDFNKLRRAIIAWKNFFIRAWKCILTILAIEQ